MSDDTSETGASDDSWMSARITAYTEVCRSYNAVDDFRAKLLALLPIVSGAGGILLLANKDAVSQHLGPIGLFGVLVTLGLFFYEIRGLKRCGRLIDVGLKLENELSLTNGQFLSRLEARTAGFISASLAGTVVYLSVLLSWIYVAYVGFSSR
jgi:hypothetical protein